MHIVDKIYWVEYKFVGDANLSIRLWGANFHVNSTLTQTQVHGDYICIYKLPTFSIRGRLDHCDRVVKQNSHIEANTKEPLFHRNFQIRCCIKSVVVRFQICRTLFLKIQLKSIEHWFRSWIDTNKRQAIIWSYDDLLYWLWYASRPHWVNTLGPR